MALDGEAAVFQQTPQNHSICGPMNELVIQRSATWLEAASWKQLQTSVKAFTRPVQKWAGQQDYP